MSTIGERLREAREAAGLSQRTVHVAMPDTSIRRLRLLERDEEAPGLFETRDLARLYRVRPEWLRTGEGPMREGES